MNWCTPGKVKRSLLRRWVRREIGLSPVRGAFLLLFAGWTAWAQVPPGAVQQLDTAIGQRVEATAVLGTQSIVSRAGLGWSLNNADGSIYKIPWSFEL